MIAYHTIKGMAYHHAFYPISEKKYNLFPKDVAPTLESFRGGVASAHTPINKAISGH
jgi:hypothetical protein